MKYDDGLDVKVYILALSYFCCFMDVMYCRITCFLQCIRTLNARFSWMEKNAQVSVLSSEGL
jgi:hypothetical protein